jgi:hypothetical protein
MRIRMRIMLAMSIGGLWLLSALPVLAHHAFSAEFEKSKTVTLKGVMTKLEWMNPHIWVYLDVMDDSGTIRKWQCEGGPPNSLTRKGWRRDALKVGDEITIHGYLAKDGTNTCSAATVVLPGGKSVFASSYEDSDQGGAEKK